MSHLSSGELIDLAEGALAEAATPHLAACAECRARLTDVRSTMALAAAVEVPEPSPLFWQRFSTRVSEAVAADGGRPAGSRRWLRALVPAVAALVLVVAAVTILRAPSRPSAQPRPAVAVIAPSPTPGDATSDVLNDSTIANDPSLALVGDLVSDIGLDGASEAGLTPDGTADHALTHMSAAELGELRRILQNELGVS